MSKRYLEAFKQMTTVDTAGPVIVLGVLKAILGDATPNTLSLVTLGTSLIAFIVSLLGAMLGILLVTGVDLSDDTGSASTILSFLALILLVGAIVLFFVGLFAAVLLLFLATLDINLVSEAAL